MAHRVLLVDDETKVTDGLKRVLRKEPYEIVCASSGKEALEILEKTTVDLIVSDEDMPGMRGTELLAEVRGRWPDSVRIILTGKATLAVALRAINEGEVHRLLSKPCNGLELADLIRGALAQRDLMLEAKKLLREARRRRNSLEELEKRYPGITKLETDEDGAIITDEPLGDLPSLLREISDELQWE